VAVLACIVDFVIYIVPGTEVTSCLASVLQRLISKTVLRSVEEYASPGKVIPLSRLRMEYG
jgi:hypothetical protein